MKTIHTNNNEIIDIESVFKRLNEGLSEINQSLALVCAGGFVMQWHGYRATIDIDAFYNSNAEIDLLIKKVGDEFSINRPDAIWLNNSIINMNPTPPEEYCKIIYHFPNLAVKIVGIIYLVGMKLENAREQDIVDVGDILKHENNSQPLELLSKLFDMKFNIDVSILLDAYEKAHGMDWLDDFYVKNQTKLCQYF